MKNKIKNLPASVHARLLEKARQTNRPFNELLQYFAIERLLYRLSRSKYEKNFVLKGAMMLNAWTGLNLPRPTRDIDLLGHDTPNRLASLERIVRDICAHPVPADGIYFHAGSVRAERITEDADYAGARIKFSATLGSARMVMQLDIGFGDVVIPGVRRSVYPVLLDFPPPRLRGYSKESTVAEKFEAAVKLGAANSRMKDFFDLWLMPRMFDFQGQELAKAIQQTFSIRQTELEADPDSLTPRFANDENRQRQWSAFRRKSNLEIAPEGFADVVREIASFLQPVIVALTAKRVFQGSWRPPGPWRRSRRRS